jgi:hypothetical protein
MASLRSRKTVLISAASGVLLAAVCVWWLKPRPDGAESPEERPLSRLPDAVRRPVARDAERRASGVGAALGTDPASQGDPAWDSEVMALWRTVEYTTLDTVAASRQR